MPAWSGLARKNVPLAPVERRRPGRRLPPLPRNARGDAAEVAEAWAEYSRGERRDTKIRTRLGPRRARVISHLGSWVITHHEDQTSLTLGPLGMAAYTGPIDRCKDLGRAIASAGFRDAADYTPELGAVIGRWTNGATSQTVDGGGLDPDRQPFEREARARLARPSR